MKKYISMLQMLLLGIIFTIHGTSDTALFVITVQFPSAIRGIPGIRGYCAGEILPCDFDYTTNRICFTARMPKYRTLFDVVITPKITYDIAPTQSKQSHNSTLHCLKVPENQSYKCYTLELITILPHKQTAQIADIFKHTPEYKWRIVEQTLPDRQIPDQAIIICTDPDFISHLSGGSAVELPKIMIKEDIISQVGSEKKLHDLSTRYLLDLMHIDLLHANTIHDIKTVQHENAIIALNVR